MTFLGCHVPVTCGGQVKSHAQVICVSYIRKFDFLSSACVLAMSETYSLHIIMCQCMCP